MLELLFLLLPVAAGYGWIMGRNTTKHQQLSAHAKLSKQYSAGLNFLLSNQEEKAVEHLIAFLKSNADTLETHLALANLFRKRGEIDKAIEIHEYLTKLQLSAPSAARVQLELVQDYISAGMLDRAEECLLQMPLTDEHRDAILTLSVAVYQTMKDWHKSDELCNRYQDLPRQLTITLSHHCCELAELEEEQEHKINWYKKALLYDQNCIRSHLAIGQYFQAQQSWLEAITYYQTIIDIDQSYTPMILNSLEQCYVETADRQGFYQYLGNLINQSSSPSCNVSLVVKYSAYLAEFKDQRAGLRFILQSLEEEPTVCAFVQVLELESQVISSSEAAEHFTRIKTLVTRYLDKQPTYECHHCGFATKLHYWICPSCQTWGSSRPSNEQTNC